MKMNLPPFLQFVLVVLAIVQFVVIIYYANRNQKLSINNEVEVKRLFDMANDYEKIIDAFEKDKTSKSKSIEELLLRCAVDSARLSYYSKSTKGLIEKIDQLKDSVNLYKINYKNGEIENLNLKLQLQTIAKESFIKTIQAIDLDERFLLLQQLYNDTEAEYEKCINDFHSDSEKYIKKCLYCDKRILNEKTWCDHNCQSSYFKEINSK